MSLDLPTYFTLASAYAGLGAVVGLHLRSSLSQHGSGAITNIPQAAVVSLVPLVCQDTWVKDQFSASKTHRNNLALNADIIALRAGNDQKADRP